MVNAIGTLTPFASDGDAMTAELIAETQRIFLSEP
jgi:hypothetical protein